MFDTLARSRIATAGLFMMLFVSSIKPNVFAESFVFNPDRQLVWGVAFSPDDRYVVATGEDGAVLMWERESCGLQSVMVPLAVTDQVYGAESPRIVTGIAWSPTKPEFATAMRDGSVRLWQIGRDGNRETEEKAVYDSNLSTNPLHLPGLRSVAFSPDGSLLAAAGHGPLIYVWKTVDATAPLLELDGQTNVINTVAFGRDNSTLISAGIDGTIRFWDLERKTVERTIKTSKRTIRAVVSSDRHYLAVTSYNVDQGVVTDRSETLIYDVNTGEEVRRFTIRYDRYEFIWSHAFSPDNRFLAVGTIGGSRIRLFDLEQGQEAWVLAINNDSNDGIKDLVFSHSGQYVLAGVWGDGPHLLDAKTGLQLKRYGGALCEAKQRGLTP